jgi:hypothetical protein
MRRSNIMPKYHVNTDIVNTNQLLSKEYGWEIPKGSVLEFEEVPERINQLEKIGVVTNLEKLEEEEPPADDPGAQESSDLAKILDASAQDAIKQIDEELSKQELSELYTMEESNKNRKTVKEHIDSLLNA